MQPKKPGNLRLVAIALNYESLAFIRDGRMPPQTFAQTQLHVIRDAKRELKRFLRLAQGLNGH